jgi:hypothetical protein
LSAPAFALRAYATIAPVTTLAWRLAIVACAAALCRTVHGIIARCGMGLFLCARFVAYVLMIVRDGRRRTGQMEVGRVGQRNSSLGASARRIGGKMDGRLSTAPDALAGCWHAVILANSGCGRGTGAACRVASRRFLAASSYASGNNCGCITGGRWRLCGRRRRSNGRRT